MAPIHSRIEKPPKSWRQNLTHSGVVGGGVSALGPSRARISWALLWVRPWGTQDSLRTLPEKPWHPQHYRAPSGLGGSHLPPPSRGPLSFQPGRTCTQSVLYFRQTSSTDILCSV